MSELKKTQGAHTPATPGLKLIIAYKLAKAPVMLGLAIWLTLAPSGAYNFVEDVVDQLSAAGNVWSRLAEWIDAHFSLRVVHGGAALAWLDGLLTTAEAVLLLMRKPLGEWLVAIGLGSLLPLELFSFYRKPGVVKVLVLLINGAVVLYLVRRRLIEARLERGVVH